MPNPLDEKLSRFEELERQLVDPEVLTNPARLTAVAREHGSLGKLAKKYRRFKSLNAQILEAMEMAKSGEADMRELAEAELPELKAERESLWNELLDMTIGGEDANRTRCVLEIRAGTGGEEAALFARDLYQMYKHYAEDNRWKVEVLDMSPTELGGFKEIILGLEGEEVYRRLQFESGGHRVQRVPETEAKGRIHTSAATVAVLPEAEEVDIKIEDKDLRIDVFRSSGPGGQSVNTTDSAVRITHIPTGVVVQQQDEKSQHKNKAKAMKVLRARLYDRERQANEASRSASRKSQVGSGDRSERIRTYNFPQGRVSDHRINLTLYKIDKVMDGEALDEFIDALLAEDRAAKLAESE